MLRCIHLAISPLIPQIGSALVQLPSRKQRVSDTSPAAHVDAQPPGDEPIVIEQRAVVAVDQIKDCVVGAALFERQFHHAREGRAVVALMPFEVAHLPLQGWAGLC